MDASEIVADAIWEGTSPTFMARWQGSTGGSLQQSQVTAIGYEAWDLDQSSTANPVASSTNLGAANVVFNTLQTDNRWTKDATGYNFRHTMGSSVFAIGGHTYRVEYKLTESSTGAPVSKVAFRLFAKNSLMD
jgi:hypothetical protein